MPRPAQELTWTVPEAARLIGVSSDVAYSLIARGDLPALRIGRRLVVAKTALAEWLEANKTGRFAGVRDAS